MSDSHQQLPEDNREPGLAEKLTAYVFDELDPAARAEVEAAVAADPELAARLAALSETRQLLGQWSAAEGTAPDLELDGSKREALRLAATAAATAAAGATGTGASSPAASDPGSDPGSGTGSGSGSGLGTILRARWLQAAAAVLLVSIGATIWPGGFWDGSGMSVDAETADIRERIMLESLGYQAEGDTGARYGADLPSPSRDAAFGLSAPADQGFQTTPSAPVAGRSSDGQPVEPAEERERGAGLADIADNVLEEVGEPDFISSSPFVSGEDIRSKLPTGVDSKATDSLYFEPADSLRESLLLSTGYADSEKFGEAIRHAQNENSILRLEQDKLQPDAATVEAFAGLIAKSGAVEGSDPAVLGVPLVADSAAAAPPGSPATPGSPAVELRTRNKDDAFGATRNRPQDGAVKLDEIQALAQLQAGGGGGYKGPGDAVPPPAETSTLAIDPNLPKRVDGGLGGEVLLRDLEGTIAGGAAAPADPAADAFDLSSQLGYIADFDLEAASGEATREEVDGRYYRYFLDEAADEDEGGESSGQDLHRRRGLALHDGYGRRYHGNDVVHHIRPVHGKEPPRDMFYRYYGDNPFVIAARDSFSTFAADVDTASYPLARKHLSSGKLPPRAAVRTEEFLNYFDAALAPPTEGDFAVHLAAAPTPFSGAPDRVLLRVGVKAREVNAAERKPLNLVFVIDKSGSMKENNRMELVKRSLELLVDQIRPDDTIGIVSFDSTGHVVTEPTPGSRRWDIRDAIRGLQPSGSTNAGEGLFLGYEMVERSYREGAVNRVILASDGVANTGETDQARILERVSQSTERAIDLTSIGVGMGNHNDVFLEQIANQGDGSCHYIDDFEEAKRVFVDGFTGTLQTVARDVKIQVEFNDQLVTRWRQLGYENRSLTQEQFRDDSVDAGEVGAGHSVVALYELQLAGDPADRDADAKLATVRLRWFSDDQDPGLRVATEQEYGIGVDQITASWEEAPAHFRLAASVVQYAEVLRRSFHARGDDYARLEIEVAKVASELAEDEAVSELSRMIRSTRKLARFLPPQDELWQLIEESRRITLLQQELRQVDQRQERTDELLAELKERNDELEKRILQHLDQGR